MLKRHTIIVSHGHCPDGCAAVVVAKNIAKRVEYVVGQHEKIDEQVLGAARRLKDGGQLWVTDITCGEDALNDVCELLLQKKASLGIYEHHISREFLKDFKVPKELDGEIVFDLNRCGSKVFYDTMKKKYPDRLKHYDRFIELTNDRDLWLNQHQESSELSALHGIYGDEKFIQRFVKNANPEFSDHEMVLLNYEKENLNKRIHHLINQMKISVDDDGLRYGIMTGEGKASDICNAALQKYDLEYVCLVDYNSKRVSIRSSDKFDCASFSAARGGGGHAKAAGFPIEREDFKLYP